MLPCGKPDNTCRYMYKWGFAVIEANTVKTFQELKLEEEPEIISYSNQFQLVEKKVVWDFIKSFTKVQV